MIKNAYWCKILSLLFLLGAKFLKIHVKLDKTGANSKFKKTMLASFNKDNWLDYLYTVIMFSKTNIQI